ncbi:MAG TPA: DUF6624 domain-containing protein [Blastocatellia bacterium]|nr:DUF6624 domain-containing protein [Blastocatellia bacterium]
MKEILSKLKAESPGSAFYLALVVFCALLFQSPAPQAAGGIGREELQSESSKPQESPKPQEKWLNPELRGELVKMYKEDQDLLKVLGEAKDDAERKERANRVKEVAHLHFNRMKEIVNQYGWPGKTMVGSFGAQAAFLMVQHSDGELEFQKKCLELLKEAAAKKEATLEHVAYLTDRILVAEKKKQVYGTQFGPCEKDDPNGPCPIEDPEHVEDRRKEMGMMPLTKYMEMMRQMRAKQETKSNQ